MGEVSGKWTFAPAYDLTFSTSSNGFHSTTVASNGESPGTKELLELAQIFGVKGVKLLIERVRDTLSSWKRYAQDAGLDKQTLQSIRKEING
ncbi:MAG: hypothetical protein AAF694_08300 [Bacteroidota bacterium]